MISKTDTQNGTLLGKSGCEAFYFSFFHKVDICFVLFSCFPPCVSKVEQNCCGQGGSLLGANSEYLFPGLSFGSVFLNCMDTWYIGQMHTFNIGSYLKLSQANGPFCSALSTLSGSSGCPGFLAGELPSLTW